MNHASDNLIHLMVAERRKVSRETAKPIISLVVPTIILTITFTLWSIL